MILSRYNVKNISSRAVELPPENLFELPEKVLQFGTGVLLRGLPDYFIDNANRQGIFNGRIVVVKSTTHGDTSAFDKQDCLYTLCVRGVEQGVKKEENIINASISRVLSAHDEWAQVLECAHNTNMQVIISNTTEVGIELVNDDIRRHPPVSFPGKLLAFLYERFRAFDGSAHSGMVVIPTELIPENGKKLEAIVLELAHLNGLEETFIEWIEQHNRFCNSLVDRIVPGKPDPGFRQEIEEELGYTDSLLTVAEVYRLWAIEGDQHVKNILSFANADPGVVIEPDIERHRELKLRLLNGTHTLSCGVGFLAGCVTVKQSMDDELISTYITGLMQQEIAPCIPINIPVEEAMEFGNRVLDRFRNPHIRHHWSSITMNYSSKIYLRCIPVLMKYYQQKNTPPEFMAMGFAAYLFFMKSVEKKGGQYFGHLKGEPYLVQDERAGEFFRMWTDMPAAELVTEVMSDGEAWGHDLNQLPGFRQAVLDKLNHIISHGIRDTLETLPGKKVIAA